MPYPPIVMHGDIFIIKNVATSKIEEDVLLKILWMSFGHARIGIEIIKVYSIRRFSYDFLPKICLKKEPVLIQ